MNINARLISAREKAALSITDMGHWFEIQRRTMETWLRGSVPYAHRHAHIEAKLDLLEKAIKAGKHFPVPMSVTQYQRQAYLQQVLNAVSGRVSKSRPRK